MDNQSRFADSTHPKEMIESSINVSLPIAHGMKEQPFRHTFMGLLSRDRIVKNLEWIQDFIIVSLCIGQFSIMLIRLGIMFSDLFKLRDFQVITSDVLFILILVELFRLLVIYLKEQRISVGAALEVAMVSVLREVIVQGILEISLPKTLGACAFLTVLGGLLFLRVWMSQSTEPING